MKASQLPDVPGADYFIVRGAYTWGRGPTIADAIAAAKVRHLAVVHVCRCDVKAKAHPVDGSVIAQFRGDIWDGRVWGKDVTLKSIVFPANKEASDDQL